MSSINERLPDHQLNGATQRVMRTTKHLAELREELAVLRQQQEKSIVAKFDTDPPHVLKLDAPQYPLPSMVIGILIGEICYNLRSALDYFVFELVKNDSGVTQNGTQFIIEEKPERFKTRAKIGLAGISAAHIEHIERLQPYNGCNWTKALRDGSNRDKHRDFAEIKGDFVATAYSPLDDRDFAKLRFPVLGTPTHPLHGNVPVKINFISRIHFTDGTPIIETLEEIKLGVTETLEVFKSEFK